MRTVRVRLQVEISEEALPAFLGMLETLRRLSLRQQSKIVGFFVEETLFFDFGADTDADPADPLIVEDPILPWEIELFAPV